MQKVTGVFPYVLQVAGKHKEGSHVGWHANGVGVQLQVYNNKKRLDLVRVISLCIPPPLLL